MMINKMLSLTILTLALLGCENSVVQQADASSDGCDSLLVLNARPLVPDSVVFQYGAANSYSLSTVVGWHWLVDWKADVSNGAVGGHSISRDSACRVEITDDRLSAFTEQKIFPDAFSDSLVSRWCGTAPNLGDAAYPDVPSNSGFARGTTSYSYRDDSALMIDGHRYASAFVYKEGLDRSERSIKVYLESLGTVFSNYSVSSAHSSASSSNQFRVLIVGGREIDSIHLNGYIDVMCAKVGRGTCRWR